MLPLLLQMPGDSYTRRVESWHSGAGGSVQGFGSQLTLLAHTPSWQNQSLGQGSAVDGYSHVNVSLSLQMPNDSYTSRVVVS